MKQVIVILCLLIIGEKVHAQDVFFSEDDAWLVSLPVAKFRARASDKMILMVWEESTKYPLPIVVKNKVGRSIYIDNLFDTPELIDALKKYFILVKVSDEVHAHLFNEIDGLRKQSYIDSFNNDTLKVMDANGVIVGTSGLYTEFLNLSNFILKYGLNTSYLKQEIFNYQNEKDFYSIFYLASKYLDYSLLVNKEIRPEILNLADLYFEEAKMFLNKSKIENKADLEQRLLLTQLKEELIKNKPRKVLRRLKKIEDEKIETVNLPLVSYLKYTAYRLLNDMDEFKKLESKISLLNLKQTQLIVNINRN